MSSRPQPPDQFTTTDWDQLLPKLTAAVASGSVPDLYYLDTPVPVFGAASNNLNACIVEL